MPHRKYAYYPTLFSLKNTIITQQRNNKIKAIIFLNEIKDIKVVKIYLCCRMKYKMF